MDEAFFYLNFEDIRLSGMQTADQEDEITIPGGTFVVIPVWKYDFAVGRAQE